MASEMEFEGNNVEKAADAACKKLKIPKEKLKYTVITYGSTGIFGLVGTKKAKIRIMQARTENLSEVEVEDAGKKGGKGTDLTPEPEVEEKDIEAIEPVATKDSESGKSVDDPKALGMSVLTRITELFSKDTRISVEETAEKIYYRIDSSDAAVMIGKRGMTLEAIQYLTEKIVNKHHNKKRVRIQVDIEGYLEKREKSLQELATRMAEKVESTGKATTIGQMNAYERRIVHITLKENNRVRTQSRGDGYLRKLMIAPARNASKKDKK